MENIVQISPVSVPTWAHYKDDNGDYYEPVVALALVKDKEGDTYVTALDAISEGLIEPVTEVKNFVGFTHTPPKGD